MNSSLLSNVFSQIPQNEGLIFFLKKELSVSGWTEAAAEKGGGGEQLSTGSSGIPTLSLAGYGTVPIPSAASPQFTPLLSTTVPPHKAVIRIK